MFSSNNFLQLLVIPKEISFVVGHSSFLSFLQKSNLLFNGNIFPIWPNNCFQTRINNKNKNINDPPWGHSLTYQNKSKSILFPKIFFTNQWCYLKWPPRDKSLSPARDREKEEEPIILAHEQGNLFLLFHPLTVIIIIIIIIIIIAASQPLKMCIFSFSDFMLNLIPVSVILFLTGHPLWPNVPIQYLLWNSFQQFPILS